MEGEGVYEVLIPWQALCKCRKTIRISTTSLGLVLFLSKCVPSLNVCMIYSDSCESITPHENPRRQPLTNPYYVF